jgi:hypothetical protein
MNPKVNASKTEASFVSPLAFRAKTANRDPSKMCSARVYMMCDIAAQLLYDFQPELVLTDFEFT